MRERTDKSKIKAGRGILNAESYEAWKTSREAKSVGTSCAVYDPIQQRTVNLLSVGEKKTFYVLRYLTDGMILEQFPMAPALIDSICLELGLRRYTKILSTDFLVEKPDGGLVAISVKPSRSTYCTKTNHYLRNMNRKTVEELYWAHYQIPHTTVFSDEIEPDYAWNIKDILLYYEERFVKDKVTMLMHLMAHHVVTLPLDCGRLPFKELAEKIPVEEYYDAYQKNRGNPNFHGWIHYLDK